jgi:hypothetical protein
MTPESDPAKPHFLTVSEVSEELSVGEALVLELSRSGELPVQRRPSRRRLRIERRMFEHWSQDQYAVTRRWILEHPVDSCRPVNVLALSAAGDDPPQDEAGAEAGEGPTPELEGRAATGLLVPIS